MGRNRIRNEEQDRNYQKFIKENKLLLKNKRVKTEDFGTLTCYMIRKNIVIPCSLIDEAIDAFPKI